MPSFIDTIENEAATSVEDIKDVPPFPKGTYLFAIVGNYSRVESKSEKKTPGMEWTLRPMQPIDVDPEELQTFLDATKKSLFDNTMKHTIWDSAYALSATRDFLIAFGANPKSSTKEACAELPGKQAYGTIVHRPFTDRSNIARFRAEFGSFAIAD